MQEDSSILGLLEAGEGRIAVYGDSNCLDSSHMVTSCYWLLRKILDFTSKNKKDRGFFSSSSKLEKSLYQNDNQLPSRRSSVNFPIYSGVVGKEMVCQSDSRFEVWGTKGYNLSVKEINRTLPGYPATYLGKNSNSTGDSTSVLHLDVPVFMADEWLIPAIISAAGELNI